MKGYQGGLLSMSEPLARAEWIPGRRGIANKNTERAEEGSWGLLFIRGYPVPRVKKNRKKAKSKRGKSLAQKVHFGKK